MRKYLPYYTSQSPVFTSTRTLVKWTVQVKRFAGEPSRIIIEAHIMWVSLRELSPVPDGAIAYPDLAGAFRRRIFGILGTTNDV